MVPEEKIDIDSKKRAFLEENINLENTDAIIKRISRQIGNENITEILAELRPRDLTSLLLKVYEIQAEKRKPLDILNQYTDNVLTNTAAANPYDIHKLEGRFYENIKNEFELVELSILNPIGSNSVVSNIDHKTVFSAVRSVEVLADISIALSIEAAKKRRILRETVHSTEKTVNIASAQRVARLRQRPTEEGYNAHWKMVGLITAGREEKSGYVANDLKALENHIPKYLDLFRQAERCTKVSIQLSDISIMDQLILDIGFDRAKVLYSVNNGNPFGFKDIGIDLKGNVPEIDQNIMLQMRELGLKKQIFRLKSLVSIKDKLQKDFPEVNFSFNLERTAGAGYYKNICFHLIAENDENEELVMVDGGNVDWVQKMLSDNRETAFVSGMGSELFIRKFGWRGDSEN